MISAFKRLVTEEFNALMMMNLMVVLLCLPVITIGPALLALSGTMIKILDDRCRQSPVKEFWCTFRDKFWVGIAYEAVFAGYAFILLWAQSMGLALGEDGEFVLVLTLIVGIFAAMVSVTTLLIAAGVRQSFFHSLWNGLLLALGRFPQTLLSTFCVYGMVYLGFLLYPISLVPMMVIMISVTAALSLSCLWPAYQSNILDNCLDAPSEEGENGEKIYRFH